MTNEIDTNSETKPQPTQLERAEAVADRMEKANQENLKLVERQETLRTQEILSGQTNAGKPTETKPTEETPEQYAQKIMGGET